MGIVRDIINKADNSGTLTKDVKDTLALIMSLAEAKGSSYEEQIKQDLLTGKTMDNLTVSITKIIKSRTEFRAATKSGTATFVDDVKKSLGDLFGGDGKILDGIAGIVNSALTAIVGTGEGQEAEVRSYSVVTEYPAIVRFDFAFWGRNIAVQSIKAYMESVFTCVAFKSAVDVTKLTFNDFLALYGPVLTAAYGSDQAKLKEMIQQAKEVYGMFNVKTAPVSDVMLAPKAMPARKLFSITTRKATEGNF